VAERRTVRVSPAAFDQLDGQLGHERGSLGQPSVGDFIILELPAVVERFATGFDAPPRDHRRHAKRTDAHRTRLLVHAFAGGTGEERSFGAAARFASGPGYDDGAPST
jgi:hypothetical protein